MEPVRQTLSKDTLALRGTSQTHRIVHEWLQCGSPIMIVRGRYEYNKLIQTNPDLFCDFPYICQIYYNGLHLNRFCAPEHICEL